MGLLASVTKALPLPIANRTSLQTILVIVGVGAIALVLAWNLLVLTSYPPIFIDEAWNANATWNWVQTGVNFDTMHAGVMDQFGYEWMTRAFLGELPWYLSFSTLGLGLFQARLVSWLMGLVLVILVMVVGRKLYGTVTGIVAALLLSVSWTFWEASHYARQDMMLALFMLAAFLVALFALEKDRWWLHLAAGLLVGISLDIHQNALMFVPALAALYLTYYGTAIYRKRGAWLVAAGGALGIACFVIFRILPSPETYFKLFGVYLSGGGEHEIPFLNPGSLLDSAISELRRYRFRTHWLDFVIIGASVLYLLFRRSQPDRRLTAFAGAAVLSSILLIGNKTSLYAILAYPYFMLMVAATLVSLAAKTSRLSKQGVFAGALLAVMVGNNVIQLVRDTISSRAYDYSAITAQIETVIPSGARVMGLPQWWLGLAAYDYRSSLSLTFYKALNDYDLYEAMEVIRPDILIFDGALASLLVNEGETLDVAQDLYKLPRAEFRAFLAQRGEKVLEFTDPWHGTFEIYFIHWDSELTTG